MDRMMDLHKLIKTGAATEADRELLKELAIEFEELVKTKTATKTALRSEAVEKVRATGWHA